MFSLEWLTLQWQLVRPYGRYVYYSLFPSRRPEYFRKPWAYPAARPDNATPVVVFLPMTDWHARIQRSQQLAKSISAAGWQSVYVNPHLGLEYPRPYLFDPAARIAALAPRLFELHIHLAREHELHRRRLTAGESARIAREIAAVLDAGGIRDAAQVISFPAWLDAAIELRGRYGFPILYDCHDWLPGFGRTAAGLLEAESDLFREADAVILSSQFLQDRVCERQPIKAKSVLIRNGAEPLAAPRRPRPDGTPVIGYVGALDHWFDTDAVAAVASAHPAWRIHLAGRIENRSVLRLQNYRNVTFLGEVGRDHLPALFQSWRAAMIPFLINDLTLSASPIKLYEYFSAGLPVVSTRLPEVERYGDLAYLASDPADFASKAAAAVAEDDATVRDRRITAVRQETWTGRAEELMRCVQMLARPGGKA